jgi:hypothetical protein
VIKLVAAPIKDVAVVEEVAIIEKTYTKSVSMSRRNLELAMLATKGDYSTVETRTELSVHAVNPILVALLAEIEHMQCIACGFSGCATCVDSNSCSACKSSSPARDLKANCACPDGYYDDGVTS